MNKTLVVVPTYNERDNLPPLSQRLLNLSTSVDMLVVDEAHRPALRAFDGDAGERRLYERLSELARRVPRVLLLTGTPVLHQEDGFLAMLHLLDPQGYRLEDRESFRRRVRDRQTIAEATSDLSDDASPLFVGDALERLETLFKEDQRLVELCGAVRNLAAAETGARDRARSPCCCSGEGGGIPSADRPG